MDQETIKVKSLELIHKTKEFLLLKKSYEDSLAALFLIGKLKAGQKPDELPEKTLARFENQKDLELAENLALRKMRRLKAKMNELSIEIRELSDLLEPCFSPAEPERESLKSP